MEQELEVILKHDLDPKRVAKFVQEANRHGDAVYVEEGHMRVNGKSMIGMFSLTLQAGQSVKLSIRSKDEKEDVAEFAMTLGKVLGE